MKSKRDYVKEFEMDVFKKLFEKGFSEKEIDEILINTLSELLWDKIPQAKKAEYNYNYAFFKEKIIDKNIK